MIHNTLYGARTLLMRVQHYLQGVHAQVRVLASLIACFALTACPAPGPECVYADDWGGKVDMSVVVPAAKKLTEAGIKVQAGEPLYMAVGGAIDICPDKRMIDEQTIPFNVRPNISEWQNTGFFVQEGDHVSIFIHDAYSELSANSSAYSDRRGNNFNGLGLYAMILPDDMATPTPAMNDDWYYPNPTKTIDPTFFELFENDPENNNAIGSGIGGYSGLAPITGTLWLRYARTARKDDGSRNISNTGSWGERWSPWKGRFALNPGVCYGACNPAVFIPICLIDPIFGWACVAATTAGCDSSDLLPDQDNCVWEHVGNPDRPWVDGSYADNANGYEITISVGCPGTHGKYLDMVIAQDSAIRRQEQPVFDPGGCNPGMPGCRPRVDFTGKLITRQELSIKEGYTHFKMSMDPNINASMSETAVYAGTVPETGYLYFGIDDTMIKTTDKIAFPAGCDDPAHPAFVSPENEPRGCVQKQHDDPVMHASELGDAPVCYSNYIDTEELGRIQSDTLCPASMVAQVENQLNSPGNVVGDFQPECGFTNKDCVPPMGFTGHGDNIGSYGVHVITTKIDDGFSSAMNSIVKPIRAILYGKCLANDTYNEYECKAEFPEDQWRSGIVQRLYGNLIGDEYGNNPFIGAVRAAILLYVIVYGLLFMLGAIDDPQRDFVWNVLRLGIVQQMLQPDSWDFFYTHLFTFFMDGMNQLITIFAGQFMGVGGAELVDPMTGQEILTSEGTTVLANVDNPFAFADMTMSRFFSQATLIKLVGLLFASPIGWLYIIIICSGIYYFISGVIIALIIYLMSMIAIGLQIVVAPIFISFLLFEKTRGYFNNWVNYLLSFLFQPVLVFTALSMFSVFIYSAIYVLLYYDVCWTCLIHFSWIWEHILPVDLPVLCIVGFYYPTNGSGLGGLPVQFFTVLIFLILTQAMNEFNEWMTSLASELTTRRGDINLGGAAKSAYASLVAGAGGALSKVSGAASAGTQKFLDTQYEKSDKDSDDSGGDDKDSGNKDGGSGDK